MDSSVGNETLERDSGDLASDGLKARQRDRFGCVVDDQIDACERFDRSDVSALSSDDTSLHLVIGQRYNRNGCLGDLLCGKPLNRK